MILEIILFLVFLFIGYFLGKTAQKKTLNVNKNLEGLAHYWIFGFILVIIGLSFLKNWWQIIFIALGTGFFASDLKSFSEIDIPAEKIPKFPEIKIPEIKPGQEFKKIFLIEENKNKKLKNKKSYKKLKNKK